MKDGSGYFVLLAVYRYSSSKDLQYMIFDNQNAYDRWLERATKRHILVLSIDWRFVHE